MSILSKEDRKDLVYSMRKSILEHVRANDTLTESKRVSSENYVLNEASYNELLNITFNPKRETELLETEVLEAMALEQYSSLLTEDVEDVEVVEESLFGMVEEGVMGTVGSAVAKPFKKGGSVRKVAKGVKDLATAKKAREAAKTAKDVIEVNKDNTSKAASDAIKTAKSKRNKEIAKVAGAYTGTGVGATALGTLAYKRSKKKSESDK